MEPRGGHGCLASASLDPDCTSGLRLAAQEAELGLESTRVQCSGTTSCCSQGSICFSRKSTGLGCQASLPAHSVALFSVSLVPSACSTGCLAQFLLVSILLSQNALPPSFPMSLSHHIYAPNIRSCVLSLSLSITYFFPVSPIVIFIHILTLPLSLFPPHAYSGLL